MKQYQPTVVTVKDYRCYLTKLGAMDATMIFGDLVKTLSPVLSLLGAVTAGGEIKPDAVKSAFATLDGATLKNLIKTLLVDYENVMIEHDGETEKLNERLINTLFIGEVDGIFQLMFEVIKDNYGSFFANAESPFGKVLARIDNLAKVAEKLIDTESLTKTNLQGSK